MIRIPNPTFLRQPMGPRLIISPESAPHLQPLRQIRIADKVPPVHQGVVPTGLDDTPRIRVVLAAGGEDWG
jgi:hypothetical protein